LIVMDCVNVNSPVTVKATFIDETVRFVLQERKFDTLVSALSTSFPFFSGKLHYVDDEGDFVVVSSEEEFQHALHLSKNQEILRLVLTHKEDALSKLYLNKWLKKNDPKNASVLQPAIISLINQGFKPHCIKRNFNILQSNAGNIAKTVELLAQKCPSSRKRKFDGIYGKENSNKKVKLSPDEKSAKKAAKIAEKTARKEEKAKRTEMKKKDKSEKFGKSDKSERHERKKRGKNEKKERKERNGKRGDRITVNNQLPGSENSVPQQPSLDIAVDFQKLVLAQQNE